MSISKLPLELSSILSLTRNNNLVRRIISIWLNWYLTSILCLSGNINLIRWITRICLLKHWLAILRLYSHHRFFLNKIWIIRLLISRFLKHSIYWLLNNTYVLIHRRILRIIVRIIYLKLTLIRSIYLCVQLIVCIICCINIFYINHISVIINSCFYYYIISSPIFKTTNSWV